MSRADGVLVVSLTYRWFDMIASGEKLEEYRGKDWRERLLSDTAFQDADGVPQCKDGFCAEAVLMGPDWHDFHPYHTLRAQRAYTGVWLERKIRRIRWGTPRPEWSGGTVSGPCFVIEIEPLEATA